MADMKLPVIAGWRAGEWRRMADNRAMVSGKSG
jgi:hypothetical protein